VSNGPCRQQGMIDAAQLHSDNQHYRGLQQTRNLAVKFVLRQGNPPASGALYQHQIKPPVQVAAAMAGQLAGGDNSPCLSQCYMRCNGRFKSHRVDLIISHFNPRPLLQCQGVWIAQASGGGLTARGDRLESRCHQALRACARQKPTGHGGFANTCVSTSNKKTRGHDANRVIRR